MPDTYGLGELLHARDWAQREMHALGLQIARCHPDHRDHRDDLAARHRVAAAQFRAANALIERRLAP